MLSPEYSAVVIGAGPSGLATSQQLKVRGVDHVVLERDEVGANWGRVYDSLTLHTGKHLSSLPGMSFGRAAPLFIGREQFLRYLHDYREKFDLPVKAHTPVEAVRLDHGRWQIRTPRGEFSSRTLVVATGIMSKPQMPSIKGIDRYRGRVRHSVAYRRPEECRGKRVLVVGAGNSAGEIASELGRAGIDTTIAVRSGANIVPLQILGIPIQYFGWAMKKLPRTVQNVLVGAMSTMIDLLKGPPVIPRPSHGVLDSIPMIGFKLVDAIKSGTVKLRGGIEEFNEHGVRFSDGSEESFDDVILATGFRAAMDPLADLVSTDGRGFALRRNRVESAERPNLFFVGHNYDTTGALFNIRVDARLVAEAVRKALQTL